MKKLPKEDQQLLILATMPTSGHGRMKIPREARCQICKKLFHTYHSHSNTCSDVCKKIRNSRRDVAKAKIDKTRPEVKERQRVARLLRDYGMTREEYWQWFKLQDGACWMCKDEPEPNHELHVDHCHKSFKETGVIRIRGLLCDRCNKGLGQFRDRIDLLQQAIMYLQIDQQIIPAAIQAVETRFAA